MNHLGTITLFLFDYNQPDFTSWRPKFDTCCRCLDSSACSHAFNDAEILNTKILDNLVSDSRAAIPSGAESVLATKKFAMIGAFAIAMWTDVDESVLVLHDSLIRNSASGYQGAIQTYICFAFEEFVDFSCIAFDSSHNFCLRDGKIITEVLNPENENLIHAAVSGDFARAERAIIDGADIEYIDKFDHASTPLFHASMGGHAAIVRLLLRLGANPDSSNGINTVLMIASRFGHSEVVKELIAAGANVDYSDRSGGTALDNAKKHPEIVEILNNAPWFKEWPKQSRTIPGLADINDAYVTSCYTYDFQGVCDERNFRDIEDLYRITQLYLAGQISDAMQLLESLYDDYTDFYFVYLWKAILLKEMGQLVDARKTLRVGLHNSKNKYRLCAELASIEFEAGNLGEAVKWWIRCVVAQITIGQLDSETPFLYLSYVAAALGDSSSSHTLLEEQDKIRDIRLNGDGQRDVFNKVSIERNPSMRTAIELLCKAFLT